MFRYFAMRFCFYAMWIAFLASAAADLIILEELSLEMQQMKQNNKDLGSKIQRLEQNDVSDLQARNPVANYITKFF